MCICAKSRGGSDAYMRISVGGALNRPSLHVAAEWRDLRWWPEAPRGATRAYEHIAEWADTGALTRFSNGCRSNLEALLGRFSSLLPGDDVPAGDLVDTVVVPGGADLGRLRSVDFASRTNRHNRIEQGDAPPKRLLAAFHDDPYFDFVAWSLHRLASEGQWSAPSDRRFVRSDRPDAPLRFTGAGELGIEAGDIRIDGEKLRVSERIPSARLSGNGLRAYSIPGWGGDEG